MQLGIFTSTLRVGHKEMGKKSVMHVQSCSLAEQTYCFLAFLLGRFRNDDGNDDGNEIVNLKEKSCRFLYSPQVYVFFYQVRNGTVRGSAACASTGARRLRYKRINIGMPGNFQETHSFLFSYENTLRKGPNENKSTRIK